MKKDTILQLSAGLLMLLFFYTALSKVLDFKRFRFTLRTSPLIASSANILTWAIPITELVVCVLLFIPYLRLKGFYFSTLLMFLFTAYVGYMLLFSSRLPCSCGGVISEMGWNAHLWFNLAFTILAASSIYLSKRTTMTTANTLI